MPGTLAGFADDGNERRITVVASRSAAGSDPAQLCTALVWRRCSADTFLGLTFVDGRQATWEP